MFRIKTTGLDELVKKLQRAPAKVVSEVNGVFEDTAKRFVQRAQREAATFKDTGALAGQIGYRKEKDLKFNIFSASRYAGYLEFGTKRNFRPIPGFEKEAAEVKKIASTGSADEAIQNIIQWVKRKGIRFESADKYKSGKKKGQNRLLSEETTAYFIWHSINTNGIKPKPYFFKQVAIAERDLDNDIKQIAEEIFD